VSLSARAVDRVAPPPATGVRPRSNRAAIDLLAPALIVLAAATMAWSQLMLLSQGLWGDEAAAVARYINRGPSAIWSAHAWSPNNHMLFDFLTWATTGLIGVHIEATYRLWSAFPAMAGAALMTWWLWHRVDRWTASVFAVLITVTPIFFNYSVQARGYGLCFLCASVIVVAADVLFRTGSRSALICFAIGGFAGITTLVTFTGAFLGAAVALLIGPSLRRRVVVVVVAVALAALAFYAPVLSQMLSYKLAVRYHLPWYGFLWAPLRDLYGPGINTLVPAISKTAGAIASGVVLLGGVALLWRRRERRLAVLLVGTPLLTYLVIEIAIGYVPRYASMAIVPLNALAAISLAGAGQALARKRRLAPVICLVLVAFSLFTLDKFVRFAAGYSTRPIEAASTAGQIIRGLPGNNLTEPAVTNDFGGAYSYYALPRRNLMSETGPTLEHMFCTDPSPFIYVELHNYPPYPSTACLRKRGSFPIALAQRHPPVHVWLVPRLFGPAQLLATRRSVLQLHAHGPRNRTDRPGQARAPRG
jgi:hypothetical protein